MNFDLVALPPPRPPRNVHGSMVDLHSALRREDAISKGLKHESSDKRKKQRSRNSFSENFIAGIHIGDKGVAKDQLVPHVKAIDKPANPLGSPIPKSNSSKAAPIPQDDDEVLLARPSSLIPPTSNESPALPSNLIPTFRPATSLGLMSSEIDDLLPSNSGRRYAARTPEILWQQRRLGSKFSIRQQSHLPTGARSSNQAEAEAARVFGDHQGSESKIMAGPGKFLEAHSLEIELADVLLKGQQLLGNNPTSEVRSKYNVMIAEELFKILQSTAAASGPFQNLLHNLAKELRLFSYSSDKSFDQDVQIELPHIEVVSRLKRDNERMSATLVSATAALSKTEKDAAKLAAAKKNLEKSVLLLEQQLQNKSSDSRGVEEIYKDLQEDHARLQKNFHDLQRGFMMGELQDDLKESLMSGFAQTSDDRAMVEEQSAMQKLVQQLKDAREAMLNSQDDMNYWKGKYDALNEKMNHLQQSFLDAVNSLELAKVKMHGMVPNAVHCALKERYAKLLSQMGKVTSQYQRMCRKMDVPSVVKQLPPDDWRRYDNDLMPAMAAGDSDLPVPALENAHGPDLDNAEEEVPQDFVDSVKAYRERLITSYKNYRRVHGVSVVSWMALKNLTLAEFAKLEQDCFSKNSIWALALQRPVDIPENVIQTIPDAPIPKVGQKVMSSFQDLKDALGWQEQPPVAASGSFTTAKDDKPKPAMPSGSFMIPKAAPSASFVHPKAAPSASFMLPKAAAAGSGGNTAS